MEEFLIDPTVRMNLKMRQKEGTIGGIREKIKNNLSLSECKRRERILDMPNDSIRSNNQINIITQSRNDKISMKQIRERQLSEINKLSILEK